MLTSSLLAAAALLPWQEPPPAWTITRLHDVGVLCSLQRKPRPTLNLCEQHSSGSMGPEPDPSNDALTTASELAGLLEALVARDAEGAAELDFEIEPEGAFLRVTGALLRVTASAAVQEEIAALLEGMHAALLGDERLEVRAIAGPGLLDGPLLLDQEEADRRVQQLVAAGTGSVRSAGSAALIDGFTVGIQQATAEIHVADWEVEIAHGAVIYDPILRRETVGLTASVHAARVAGGTWLDLAIRYAEPAAPMRELVLLPTIWLSSPLPFHAGSQPAGAPADGRAAVVQGPVPLRTELPLTRFLSCAGSFVLPDGKALWIPCQMETRSGRVALALEVRVRGSPRPLITRIPGDPARGREWAIVPIGALGSDGFVLPRFARVSLAPGFGWDDDPWWPSLVSTSSNPERALESLRDAVDAVVSSDDDADAGNVTTHELFASHAVLEAPAAQLEVVASELPHFTALAGMVQLRGRIVNGTTIVADFQLPATLGKPALLWSGVAGSFLAGWDVDVAGEASVANPEIGWFLDGFALGFIVRPAAGKQAQIVVQGVLDFLTAPPTIETLANPSSPLIERVEVERLVLDEIRNVTLGDGTAGAAIVKLGRTPLALELTLTSR